MTRDVALHHADVSGTSFEPTDFQKLLLEVADDRTATAGYLEYMTLKCAFRVRPRISPRSLGRAFDKLVMRHDSLRLRFLKTGQGWRGKILPRHPKGLAVVDLSGLSETEQEQTLLRYAAEPVLATSDALFEMYLFQCGGDHGDVVFARANHAVGDGYSVRVVVEDLLKAVLNLPTLRRAPRYEEYLKTASDALKTDTPERVAYWNNHVLPLPQDPNIGRKAKGLPPLTPATLTSTVRTAPLLSDDEVIEANDRARRIGVSPFALYHAAFSDTLCETAQTDAVLVWSLLRDGGAKTRDLVAPNVDAIVLRSIARDGDIETGAKWVTQSIAQAADHLPTAALSPGGAIHDACKASGTTFKRFRVHAPYPFDASSAGPFSTFLQDGAGARVSVGFLSLELLSLPTRVESSYELDCLVKPTKAGQTVSFVANGEAFTLEELEALGQNMRRTLGFA